MPLLNPDGASRSTIACDSTEGQSNAAGVDLDDNFPDSFSKFTENIQYMLYMYIYC